MAKPPRRIGLQTGVPSQDYQLQANVQAKPKRRADGSMADSAGDEGAYQAPSEPAAFPADPAAFPEGG